MNNKKHRKNRLEGELKKVLAEIVRVNLKDPRLEMITFTAVKVAKDLSFAKIFISHLKENKLEGALLALNKAKRAIKKQIGIKLQLRIVPEIAFFIDDSLSYSQKINDILKEIKSNENKFEPD